MKLQKITFLLVGSALLFSSCASILNSKTTSINFATSEPARLVIENDTINSNKVGQKIEVARNQLPLNVEIIQDGKTKNIDVYSRNSAAYYANFVGIPLYGVPTLIGLVVDNKNPKRYTYPKTVNIDLNEYVYTTTNAISLTPYKTIIKTRPFSALNPYKNPRIELALETRINEKWSTQYGAAYLLPKDMYTDGLDYLNDGVRVGYSFSLEQKYYFAKNAPHGFYTSLEGRYMNRESDVVGDFFASTEIGADSYTDTFYLVSQATTANLKIGYQKIVKRVTFDVFLGLGFTHSNTVFMDRIDQNYFLGYVSSNRYNTWINTSQMSEGKEWNTKFPIGFQIGWAF
jgi:hypothetical protein